MTIVMDYDINSLSDFVYLPSSWSNPCARLIQIILNCKIKMLSKIYIVYQHNSR